MGNDQRFEKMRKKLSRISLFWILQTISILIIAIPLYITNQYGPGPLFYIGGGLACIGLIVETVADYQKFSFRTKSENDGKFMQLGLWNWVQHPNYTGEIIFWIGISLIAFHPNLLVSFTTFLSPLWITILLVKISGIPLLQKASLKVPM